MAISSVGLGSGINVKDTVAQLVALEQKPIQVLQTKATTINSQVSAFSQLKSQISNLQTQVDKLTSAATWQGRVLTSSNAATVTQPSPRICAALVGSVPGGRNKRRFSVPSLAASTSGSGKSEKPVATSVVPSGFEIA